MVLRIERYLDAVVIVNDDTGRVVWEKLHAFGKGDKEFEEAENAMERMIISRPASPAEREKGEGGGKHG